MEEKVVPKKIMITPTELDGFNKLVSDQFSYGSKKYAGSEENPQRESTDDLIDDFGVGWFWGTICKYCKRFSNLERERDLLKISCYMFIVWLKRGFHLTPQGTPEVMDTNIKIKEAFFGMFTGAVNAYDEIKGTEEILDIYDKMKKCNSKKFNEVKEEDLFFVYRTAYNIWKNKYKDVAGQDTDTSKP